MRDTERERQKQAQCREPDVGLDPRTPGSCPGWKADAQPLSHPGIPFPFFLKVKCENNHTATGHIHFH